MANIDSLVHPTSTLSTPRGPKGLYPDQTFIAQEVVPEALIYEITTVVGSIEGDEPAIRVPYVKEDPHVGFVLEGDPIYAENPQLDEVVIRTGKLATIVRQTNESASYTDANTLNAASMARSITVSGNNALLSSTPSSQVTTEPVGLMLTEGLADAPTLGDNLDAIGDAITAVEVAGGTATHIVVSPAAWGHIRSLKSGTGSNLPLIGAPADQTERRMFGLPVIVSHQMPTAAGAENVLIVDKSNILSAVGAIKLATSSEYYFGSDSLARRATWRIGWQVLDPKRLARVAINLG